MLSRGKGQPVSGRRAIWGGHVVVFGRETRYVARLYGHRALLFTCVALAIILSLDVATNISATMRTGPDGVNSVDTARLGYYILLRAGYVLASLMPIAAIVGPLWAEFNLSGSRERQMISGGGRSPIKALLPAVVFGIAIGLVQFAAISFVRPTVVEAQATSGLRYYGSKFTGATISSPIWFSVGSTIVHGRVSFDTTIGLRDVRFFGFDDSRGVTLMAAARDAVPGEVLGHWTLRSGSSWDIGALRGAEPAARTGLRAEAFESLDLPLQLDPIWVENFDIQPQLLDQSTLTILAAATAGVPNQASFRTALSERYANVLYCVGMALLGATLALVYFFPGMSIARILGVAIYGNIAYVGFSAAGMLSTFGNLPPVAGPWLLPAALALGCPLVLAWRDRGVRVRLRRHARAAPA